MKLSSLLLACLAGISLASTIEIGTAKNPSDFVPNLRLNGVLSLTNTTFAQIKAAFI